MGTRGPIPKPVDRRLGHVTKAEKEAVTKAPAKAPARRPSAAAKTKADPDWHPIAVEWFDSLSKSGQSDFYEPSDWAMARYCAELMSRTLFAERPSAQMVASLDSVMARLLVTEGDRRRARLELQKAAPVDPVQATKVTRMDAYRKAAEGGA